jgi:hypothetical protein
MKIELTLPLDLPRPHHRHDCDTCHYRGSFVAIPESGPDAHIRVYDVFVHGDRAQQSVIMRFGSEGPEYESFSRITAEMLAGLFQADVNVWAEAMKLVRTHRSFPLRAFVTDSDQELANEYGFKVEKTQRIDLSNEYGAKTEHICLVSWPNRATDELRDDERRYMLREAYPATQCHHAYDCCGHYYAGTARCTLLPNGKWLVRQSWTQNV